MTNPEQAPDIDLEAEELTDESLEDVSGGEADLTAAGDPVYSSRDNLAEGGAGAVQFR